MMRRAGIPQNEPYVRAWALAAAVFSSGPRLRESVILIQDICATPKGKQQHPDGESH